MLTMFTQGFEYFFSPASLMLTTLGCALGLFIGVIPGLGPLVGIVLLLPLVLIWSPSPGWGC